MRVIALNRKTGEEVEYEIRGRVHTFNFDQEGRLREWPTSQGLRINYDGRHNILITDEGLSQTLALADYPLEPQKPYVWAPGQTIQLGDYFLSLDRTRKLPPGIVNHIPLERISRIFVGLLVLAAILLVVWLFWSAAGTTNRKVQAVAAAESRITATVSATCTPRPTTTATRTATPTLTNTPTPVSLGDVNPKDIFLTPIPTITTTLSLAINTNPHAAPAVLPTSAATPTLWDTRFITLGVIFQPAQVAIGGEFYRLVEAQWLDEEEAHGYHHIFMDVVDQENRRLYGVTTTVSWASGSCVRPIEAKTPILLNERIYIDYGADCAMFAAGSVYTVKVNGLPSDRIANLGLGSLDQRNWNILTSFRLKFQRTTNMK